MDAVETKPNWRDTWVYWAICAGLISVIALLACYEVWMRHSIPQQFTDRYIDEYGVTSFFCSDEHFLGQSINFRYHNDDIRRYGLLCRDWVGQKWIQSPKY